MLKIRLQRVGKKHEPVFRIVLTDSKNGPKSGKFLEILGSYDPRDKNETVIKEDRVTHWMAQGAQVSDTIHNILVNKGIVKGDKINVLPKKSPIVDEEAEAAKKAEEEAAAAEAEKPAEEAPTESTEETPAEEEKEEESTPEEKEEEVKEEAPAEEEAPKEEEKQAETEEKVEEAPAEETPKEEEAK